VFRALPYFKRVRRRLGEVDAKVITFSSPSMTIKRIRLCCGVEVTFTHWFPDLVRDLEGSIARTFGTALMAQLGWAGYSMVLAGTTTHPSFAEVSTYLTEVWVSMVPFIWLSFLLALVSLAILISGTKTHFIKYRDIVYATSKS
jgi:hypothetical protein